MGEKLAECSLIVRPRKCRQEDSAHENAVESVNSRWRKITKEEAFTSENALDKLLYLCIMESYKSEMDG